MEKDKTDYVIINTPTKLPILATAFWSFMLYHFKANSLLWGIFITLYVIYWAFCIYTIRNQVRIDLNSTTTKNLEAKSKFAKRLLEQMTKPKH